MMIVPLPGRIIYLSFLNPAIWVISTQSAVTLTVRESTMGKYLHYTYNYPHAACGVIAANCTMLSVKSVDCPRCRKYLDTATPEVVVPTTAPIPPQRQADEVS
jgi:hypothetical protein